MHNLHYEKYQDGTVKCIEDEIPFEVSDGWTWCRLGTICTEIQYGLSNSAESSGSHRLLRITDIQDGRVDWDSVPFTTVEDENKYLLRPNDIVFARTGATVGKSFLISETPYKSVYASYLIRIRLLNEIDAKYVYHFFNSACYWSQITKKSVGVGQPNCNGTALQELFIPLPPAQEQARIVPIANDLLEKTKDIEYAKESLVDILSTAKAKVLDLAIRGKLVSQNSNDEPASVLLERIRSEKEDLIRQGKLKRDKKESIIYKGDDNSYYEKFADGSIISIDEELPFDIPTTWHWCRFSTITINRDSERKPVSTSKRKDVKKIYDYYGASGKIDKIDNYLFDERLLLIGEDGANLVTRSKPIAFFAEGKYWVNNHAHCIDATDKKLLDYICIYINAINLEKYVTGSAQPKMNQDNMNSILIPVPPIVEQKRICKAVQDSYALIKDIEGAVKK
ncbi:restriction endonuclease subunit S [Butyrivibrio sp. MB2005]|uniref:restriction endonuclease subunit S n=1 Tax=Butyrivibrio sp. MB2005 TaxID=1280678 RepID=UPI0006843D6D|nr:restriction endonuclease subunit S [Butyrivibrio sp. MB2005]